MAGPSHCCNHVITCIYKIEHPNTHGYTDLSCTSTACAWNKSTIKVIEPKRIFNIVVGKRIRSITASILPYLHALMTCFLRFIFTRIFKKQHIKCIRIYWRILKSTMERIYFENIQQMKLLHNEVAEMFEVFMSFRHFFDHQIARSKSNLPSKEIDGIYTGTAYGSRFKIFRITVFRSFSMMLNLCFCKISCSRLFCFDTSCL